MKVIALTWGDLKLGTISKKSLSRLIPSLSFEVKRTESGASQFGRRFLFCNKFSV